MGIASSAGRFLFSAIFILAAWHKIEDFGRDGGSAIKAMEPKLALFKGHVIAALGYDIPHVETKHLLMAAIALEGIGGILFTFGSSLGAYLLLIFLASVTPIMHDFYNYDLTSTDHSREFTQFLKNLALFGALIFFLGMKKFKSIDVKKVKAKTN